MKDRPAPKTALRIWRGEDPHTRLVGVETDPSLWKTVWYHLEHILYDPVNPLFIRQLEKLSHNMGRRMFLAALLIKAKTANGPNPHGHENGLKNTDRIHTMKYYIVVKMNKLN